MTIDVPKSVIKTVFFFYNSKANSFEVTFFNYESWSKDEWGHYIKVGEKEIEFHFPNVNLTEADIARIMFDKLYDQKEETLARHHMEIKEIDEKISNFLCIEFGGNSEDGFDIIEEEEDNEEN